MSKLGFNPLFSFISPVTGRIPLTRDYILIGDRSNISQKSPALIDIKLDILDLKKKDNDFLGLSFILKTKTDATPNAQALDILSEGFLYNTKGILSTKSVAEIFPPLSQSKLWIGNKDNIASETQTINLNNLPSLGITNYPNLTGGFYGKVYVGTSLGVPEASDELGAALTDLALINARFLAGQFILNAGIPIIKKAMPAAQYLEDLPGNSMLKTSAEVGGTKLGLILQATAGEDYLPGIAQLPYPDESNILIYASRNREVKVYGSPVKFLPDGGLYNAPQIKFDGGAIHAKYIKLTQTQEGPAYLAVDGDIDAGNMTSAVGITLWDAKRAAHRSEDGVTLMGPGSSLPLGTKHRWYMPSEISKLGQVLKDVGGSLDPQFPNARTLGFGSVLPDGLEDGLLAQKTEGEGSDKKTVIVNATLTKGKVWLGDENNKPVETVINILPTNLDDGLLAQGRDEDNEPMIINATLTKGKMWQGNEENKPVETELDIAPTNATYILQRPDANLSNAQALSELGVLPGGRGMLKCDSSGAISIASGGTIPEVDDYLTPEDYDILEAEILAIYPEFLAEMLPFTPIPNIGSQITAAIAVALATAIAAIGKVEQEITDAKISVNTRIDGLTVTLIGDVAGTNNISKQIITEFAPNPKFQGKSGMKIPVGTTSDRGGNTVVGTIRFNTDLR